MFIKWGLDYNQYTKQERCNCLGLILLTVALTLFVTSLVRVINALLYLTHSSLILPNPIIFQIVSIIFYFVLTIAALAYAYKQHKIIKKNFYFVSMVVAANLSAVITVIVTVACDVTILFETLNRIGAAQERFFPSLLKYFSDYWFLYLFPIAIIIATNLTRRILIGKRFDIHKSSQNTTKSYGSAEFADREYLKEKGLYKEEGSIFGKDRNGNFLRTKLCNRTIISSPGGGKSTGITIPTLLTENRPVFVHDPKGELWAVTARHRYEKFGRKIITIDPFGVTERRQYKDGKPSAILKKYTINPFDYIPEDNYFRDRVINSLATAMVVSDPDTKYGSHFEDNAKILIGGLIDYINRQCDKKDLLVLHDLITQNKKSMDEFLEMLSTMDNCPRSKAAASLILGAGADERGSIYTTTYRQLRWLVDLNLRQTFAESNCDLRDFIEDNADIFIIMPEDQVREQSRVMRMVLSLTQSLAIQTDIDKLSRKKYLYVLDELGQIGYCEDVESAIEILRARGFVIWSIFQDYSQIKLYRKPGLFINAQMKQIFACDDPDIMTLIQKLGGTKTILTENISNSKGDSNQKNQVLSGSISKGESRSVHETGVNLIHFNEIRELADNEQFVFIRGIRPIKCERVTYYKEPLFMGMYDKNPLEFLRE